MTEPIQYETGGTLTDARGVVWPIARLSTNTILVYVNIAATEAEPFLFKVDPRHYIYSAPVRLVAMTRELQEKMDRLSARVLAWEAQGSLISEETRDAVSAYKAAKGAAK